MKKGIEQYGIPYEIVHNKLQRANREVIGMTYDEWLSLQLEYGVRVYGVKYKEISKGSGRILIAKLLTKLEDKEKENDKK